MNWWDVLVSSWPVMQYDRHPPESQWLWTNSLSFPHGPVGLLGQLWVWLRASLRLRLLTFDSGTLAEGTATARHVLLTGAGGGRSLDRMMGAKICSISYSLCLRHICLDSMSQPRHMTMGRTCQWGREGYCPLKKRSSEYLLKYTNLSHAGRLEGQRSVTF